MIWICAQGTYEFFKFFTWALNWEGCLKEVGAYNYLVKVKNRKELFLVFLQ